MTTTAFHRARSEEQRAERRESILATAESMLVTTRVSDLSLNELARRVGLAKSNVLRYFESREAVLLAIYDRQTTEFLDALDARIGPGSSIDELADAIAELAADRPVFCDLTASAPGVLEHNVSTAAAVDYKRGMIANAVRLARIAGPVLGDVGPKGGEAFAGGTLLVVGGAWALTQPSPGMAAAYAQHAELRAMQLELRTVIRELLATLAVGLQHRRVGFSSDVPAVAP